MGRISLICGNLQGNFAISGVFAIISTEMAQRLQALGEEIP
jgi:hypothetical protein